MRSSMLPLLLLKLQLGLEMLAANSRLRAGTDRSCITASTEGPGLTRGPLGGSK